MNDQFNDNKLKEMLENGCVLYSKNGIIEYVKAPDYGEITIAYHGGKYSFHRQVINTK